MGYPIGLICPDRLTQIPPSLPAPILYSVYSTIILKIPEVKISEIQNYSQLLSSVERAMSQRALKAMRHLSGPLTSPKSAKQAN